MQAAPRPEDRWDDNDPQPETSRDQAMRDYAARRCHICQGKYPPFGFGPPLTRAGQTLWACLAHLNHVDRMVSTARSRAEKRQGTLFEYDRSP